MSAKILVTGGAGYIGSHVVAALAAAGYAPVVVDNFSNSERAVIPRLRAVVGNAIACEDADVRDRAALRRIFSNQEIAAVIHCAGLKAVGESGEQPMAYYDNNVVGTMALLDAMTAARVRTLVFSSSATVYGQPERNPVPETAALVPANVYGRTKRMVEQILEDIAVADASWRIGLLRYFNPGGAHSSGRIGEAPSGRPNNLLPLLAEVAAGTRNALDVYGNDWPTPDGTGVRDYIHVVDLAEGHVAALAHLARVPGLLTLNLGVGRGYSVLEVIAAYERAVGRPLAHRIAPRRAGDIGACYADVEKAHATLAWRAQRDIDAICSDGWRWQQARMLDD
jgi:UDP-glucose 4-epimerase